jgi:hypothetical protein
MPPGRHLDVCVHLDHGSLHDFTLGQPHIWHMSGNPSS